MLKLTGSFEYTPTPVDRSILANVDELFQMVLDGKLHSDFTPKFAVSPDDYEKSYRTAYMFIRIPKLNCPMEGADEYRAALGRMIALRAPEVDGFAEQLGLNQSSVLRKLRVPINCFRNHLELHIDRKHYEEEYDVWLFKPCAKKKLRLRVEQMRQELGKDNMEDMKYVEYKLKPGELLAEGKKRAVADLGALRTQATAWAFDNIKEAWSVPFEFKSVRAVFVKSSTKGKLREAFADLINPGEKIQFYYHSDDSCVSAMCADGRVFFNGDIKACDGSHRRAIIELLREILTKHKDDRNCTADAIDRAINYLYRDLRVYNRHNRRQRVVYKFNEPRLYSGSVITTTLNNLANLLIAMALARRVPDPRLVTKAEFKEAYCLAGVDCGYMLKVIDCDVEEDLQFLKHSPYVAPDGEIEPWMNLGTFVRGFGTVSGELPGKGTQLQRAQRHCSEVVVGRRNWGSHVLNDAFQRLNFMNIGMTELRNTQSLEHDVNKSVGDVGLRIPIESLCRRYRCLVEEMEEFCTVVGAMQMGSYIDDPFASVLYHKDYG